MTASLSRLDLLRDKEVKADEKKTCTRFIESSIFSSTWLNATESATQGKCIEESRKKGQRNLRRRQTGRTPPPFFKKKRIKCTRFFLATLSLIFNSYDILQGDHPEVRKLFFFFFFAAADDGLTS